MSAPCPTFGFVVRLQKAQEAAHVHDIVRDLAADVLAPRGLAMDPGPHPGEYIITGEGMQATSADRDAVTEWLSSRSDVRLLEASPLIDVKEMV